MSLRASPKPLFAPPAHAGTGAEKTEVSNHCVADAAEGCVYSRNVIYGTSEKIRDVTRT
jgi:hypothetical protein